MDRYEFELAGSDPDLASAAQKVRQKFPGVIDTPIGWRRPENPNEVWIHIEAEDGEAARSAILELLWEFRDVQMRGFGMTIG